MRVFLDLIPHQGYTVHQITKEEAESLYEIMEIIELGTLRKAVRALTPKKLEELEEKKRLYENAVVDQVSRGRFTLDQEFHASLVQMSDTYIWPIISVKSINGFFCVTASRVYGQIGPKR